MTSRFFLLVLIFLLPAFGCGGCDEECAEECADGFVCQDGDCVPAEGCAVPCDDGEVCTQGQCIPEDGQCSFVGELCTRGLPVQDDFFCLDFDDSGPAPATCVERCDATGACSPGGGLCFFVSTRDDLSCTLDTECDERQICEGGACRDTVCIPSECEGFSDGAQTCTELYLGDDRFVDGGQCVNGGNDSYFCVPAGPRQLGEACEDLSSAISREVYTETCASGLACIDSVCRDTCKLDADCGDGSVCLLEDDDFVDTDTGFCGVTCRPFEVGSCGPGQTCFPIAEGEGTCIAAGTREAFQSCQPGAGECVDGTLCITFEEAPVGGTALARCQPWCDVSVAPAGDDGVVGDFEQAQRDATCPQPETPAALLSVVNLAQLGSAVDLYVGDDPMPAVEGLEFENSTNDGGDFLGFDAGNYAIRVLPAAAPVTDPALFEGTVNLQSEVAKVLVIHAVAGASDEAQTFDLTEVRATIDPAMANVRVLHASPDAGPVDVVLVPPGDPLTDPMNQTVLAQGVDLGDLGLFETFAAGSYDLLVFPAGDPRTDRASALISGLGLSFADGDATTLGLVGTVDENDVAQPRYTLIDYLAPPELGSSGPRFTCVSTGDDILGFCQQECGDDPAVFGLALCEGAEMGCRPLLLPDSNRWRNLCGPVGTGVDGDGCDPFTTWGECAEGLSCLEYGNTRDGFTPDQRGLCRPLCDIDDNTCPDSRGCKPLSYESDYAVGECGYPCDPGMTYTDAICPDGLGSCKPLSSLQDPIMGTIPFPREETPFCSAAGDIAIGETCSGSDCVPGSECLFPRSPQADFVSTIASPYFGGQNLTPTCTPHCDPFDGDDGPVTCGAGETCLFNFPWSAEVGHCAPIVEEVAPQGACTRPGESCGEDSICAVNGGANVCLRFCDYIGDAGDGTVAQSTCPNGLECTPFVADVGVCLAPM